LQAGLTVRAARLQPRGSQKGALRPRLRAGAADTTAR